MAIINRNNFVAAFLLLMLLTACYDNSDCANRFSDHIQIRFIKAFTADSIAPRPLELIRVRALEATRTLFEDSISSAVMSFEANPFGDTTTYIFEQTEAMDTIMAIFDRKPYLINPECGMTMIFNIDTVIASFDSVKIVNSGLRYVGQGQNNINLEVYY